MSNELNIVLSAKKILSVNSLYNAMIVNRGGRNIPTIYKSREAKNVESWIGEQIRALDISKNYPWITKDTLFSYSINVIFKNGYLSRDLDNTLKLVQDGIFRALDVNDSHVVQIFAKKSYMPEIEDERICISLREFKNSEELRFNYIPVPSVIWTEWDRVSELGFKVLKTKKMSGNIYTTDDKDRADTKLIVIQSPLSLNTFGDVYLEVMENLVSSSGLVYIAILGDVEGTGEFKTKILEMSSQYSGIRLKEVKSVEEITNWIKEDANKEVK